MVTVDFPRSSPVFSPPFSPVFSPWIFRRRNSLLGWHEHELSVSVQEIFPADGLQLTDCAEGTRREIQVAVREIEREAGHHSDALNDGLTVAGVEAPHPTLGASSQVKRIW